MDGMVDNQPSISSIDYKCQVKCMKYFKYLLLDNICSQYKLISFSLQNVNTEVCEQVFSWLSKYACITKHMNRWRFLFLILYILDNHNENVNN